VAHYVPDSALLDREKPDLVRRGYIALAREALAFAAVAEKLDVSILHSSVDVAGSYRGVFSEGDLAKGQRFRSAGAEGRGIAEAMFRRRMPDLPLCVVRPTVVVGDSRTGEFDELDGLYLLILLVVTSPPDFTLPLPGRGDQLLNLVPIDYVARAARLLGGAPEARGRTFHLGDPSPCSARRVFELVSQVVGRRGPRGFIPANLTRALLRAPGIERIARSPRAFLEALVREGTYGFANTEAVLGEAVRCPPFESYVETLVHRVEESVKAKQAPPESLGDVEDTLL
jgi:nucleoside-diphosphate-sugar epimerase